MNHPTDQQIIERYEKADEKEKQLIRELFDYNPEKDNFKAVEAALGIKETDFIHQVISYEGDDPRMKNISGYAKVILGVEFVNKDFIPDFSKGSQNKYIPYFYDNGSGLSLYVVDYWRTTTAAGAQLFSKNASLARKVVELFPEAYKQFNTY
jgi:hypothetical protein